MKNILKFAVAAALACAVSAMTPLVSNATVSPAIDQVPCAGRSDFMELSAGENRTCFANDGIAYVNIQATYASSGNNCGFIAFTTKDGNNGSWSFSYNQQTEFLIDGQCQIVTVTEISLTRCIG